MGGVIIDQENTIIMKIFKDEKCKHKKQGVL